MALQLWLAIGDLIVSDCRCHPVANNTLNWRTYLTSLASSPASSIFSAGRPPPRLDEIAPRNMTYCQRNRSQRYLRKSSNEIYNYVARLGFLISVVTLDLISAKYSRDARVPIHPRRRRGSPAYCGVIEKRIYTVHYTLE